MDNLNKKNTSSTKYEEIPTNPNNRLPSNNADSIFNKVSKHPRYLSDWAENIISINITENGEEIERIRSYNINDIWLPSNYPIGPFKDTIRLSDFPHWVQIYKLVANETLHNNTTSFGDRVKRGLTIYARFFAWCVQNGIYELSQLSQRDFKELGALLAEGGWNKALNMEDNFLKLLHDISTNKELLDNIVNTTNSKGSLNIQLICKLTGLPLSHLPSYVYKEIHSLAGINSSPSSGRVNFGAPPNIETLSDIFSKINLIRELPCGTDMPAFLPYPNVNSFTKSILNNNFKNKTKNISLEDSIKLLDLSVKYIYDYAPGIIVLGNTLILWLKNNTHQYTSKHGAKFIQDNFQKLSHKYKFPPGSMDGISHRRNGKNKRLTSPDKLSYCFMDLIHALQTACMIMIAFNHGRRKNEVLGEGHRPYGIYYGCISELDLYVKHYKIDIYIEKTIKDWCTFSCNKLVNDAVSTLEKIYDLFRSFNESSIQINEESIDLRKMKLFQFKNFTFNSLNKDNWMSYNFFNHSSFFLHQACLIIDTLNHKTHPFRRIFCNIYYQRYENPRLIALSEHLKHHSLTQTRGYVTDPVSREYADSIEALYQKETNQFNDELKSVGREYLKEKISEIINEKPTGGGLSKTSHALYKHLLRRVEFRSLDSDEQTEELSNELLNLGYEPTPFKHGVCMLSPKCNQSKASCFKENDKIAHKENACLKQCMKCRYNFDNENYLDALKKEANELSEMATDFSITTAERLAYQESAINLDKLIQLEAKIQIKNAEKVTTMKANAYLVWGINDHLNISIKNEQRACINNSETESLTKHQQ